MQRCQVHKRRNVLDHLSEEHRPAVQQRLNAAYALQDYAAAKQALTQLLRELMDLGGHLKTGHTWPPQNRPTELGQDKSIYSAAEGVG